MLKKIGIYVLLAILVVGIFNALKTSQNEVVAGHTAIATTSDVTNNSIYKTEPPLPTSSGQTSGPLTKSASVAAPQQEQSALHQMMESSKNFLIGFHRLVSALFQDSTDPSQDSNPLPGAFEIVILSLVIYALSRLLKPKAPPSQPTVVAIK